MSLNEEFSQLRGLLDVHRIADIGLHVKMEGDGFYVDFELGDMSEPMKRQLFDQLVSLVTTYKSLSGFIRENGDADSSRPF